MTPAQFNKLVTRDEFNERFNDLESRMMTKDDKSEIMSAMDKIAKDLKDIKAENTINHAAHDRIQEDVNEVRTHVKLEVKHPMMRK